MIPQTDRVFFVLHCYMGLPSNKEHSFTNYCPAKVVTQEEVTCFQQHEGLLTVNKNIMHKERGVDPFLGLKGVGHSKKNRSEILLRLNVSLCSVLT